MTGRHAVSREAALKAVNTPAGRGVAAAVAVGAMFGVVMPSASATDETLDNATAANLSAVENNTIDATDAVTAPADAEWNVEQVALESSSADSSDVELAVSVDVPEVETTPEVETAAEPETTSEAATTAYQSGDDSASGSTQTIAVNSGISSATGSAVLATALSYVGSPYVAGGVTPSGWDCIGFVRYVYAQYGVSIGGYTTSVLSAGTQVSYADAQPGDILYWPGHVAIYAGNGQNVGAWNASMGTRVGPNSWVGGTPIVIRVAG
ncbi:C40 family peptidase [Changpingibacter yushuensis]|uniref:C40 family peptidase n=1 Tax=Changpingibacter yushuensis TaxID=2758440 RepID=UPI0015F6518B|nr:NlpC/P60 family protein [Changpingibacter yushuensis]